MMKKICKFVLSPDSVEDRLSKAPIIIGIILVYISTLFVQLKNRASLNSTIAITIIIVGQLIIYLLFDTLFRRKHWIYFFIQGVIISSYSFVTPKGFEYIFLGAIPVLVFQCVMVLQNSKKIVIVSVFYYSIFCSTIILRDGINDLTQYIPTLLLISFAVYAYAIIFLKQVKLRIKTQRFFKELEFAYERVEELTLTNERQRMARDLHDTLSQGLAGIIMQLEAVDANLNNNNIIRAQEIVGKSMEHARKTLLDSRRVIDDLRSQIIDDLDINKAIENEVTRFKAISNTLVTLDIKVVSQLPIKISKNIIYIIREALNNIAKHAKAKNASIEIIEQHNNLIINIKDDGIGFDTKILDQLLGHYGIQGMAERVRVINGNIEFISRRKTGTSLNIIIPLEKGINIHNEEENICC